MTITWVVDESQAAQAIGQERVQPMLNSLERVKQEFERALVGSNATLSVPLVWNPALGQSNAAASARTTFAAHSWSTVRDRLLNVGNEPPAETVVYENLPATTVPFLWAIGDNPASPRTSVNCLLTYAQAQQLGLNPQPPSSGQLQIEARTQSSTFKWQFFPGDARPGFTRFEAVMKHEVLHLLGFQSVADSDPPVSTLQLMDVFRFPDGALPIGPTLFSSGVRELRPDQVASVATRNFVALGNGAYRLSRGKRAGGDDYQASHFRSLDRLIPPKPIGLMDPVAEQAGQGRVAEPSRADWEVLDICGWTLDPAQIRVVDSPRPMIPVVAPPPGAIVRSPTPTFTWADTTTDSLFYKLNVGSSILLARFVCRRCHSMTPAAFR